VIASISPQETAIAVSEAQRRPSLNKPQARAALPIIPSAGAVPGFETSVVAGAGPAARLGTPQRSRSERPSRRWRSRLLSSASIERYHLALLWPLVLLRRQLDGWRRVSDELMVIVLEHLTEVAPIEVATGVGTATASNRSRSSRTSSEWLIGGCRRCFART
jgi:hypothetical protein